MRLREKFAVPFVTELEKIEFEKMEKEIRATNKEIYWRHMS
jgi:hypothetical protein